MLIMSMRSTLSYMYFLFKVLEDFQMIAISFFLPLTVLIDTSFAVVRGEIARREYNVLVELTEQNTQRKLEKQLSAVVQIQSG